MNSANSTPSRRVTTFVGRSMAPAFGWMFALSAISITNSFYAMMGDGFRIPVLLAGPTTALGLIGILAAPFWFATATLLVAFAPMSGLALAGCAAAHLLAATYFLTVGVPDVGLEASPSLLFDVSTSFQARPDLFTATLLIGMLFLLQLLLLGVRRPPALSGTIQLVGGFRLVQIWRLTYLFLAYSGWGAAAIVTARLWGPANRMIDLPLLGGAITAFACSLGGKFPALISSASMWTGGLVGVSTGALLFFVSTDRVVFSAALPWILLPAILIGVAIGTLFARVPGGNPRCRRCGYDLRESRDTCPECGRSPQLVARD